MASRKVEVLPPRGWDAGDKEKPMIINKKGFREASEDLFELSQILHKEKKNHYPYLVLNTETKQLEMVSTVEELMKYPPETEFLWQWGGQWRSDYFALTVKELRKAYILKNFTKNPA